MANFPTIRNPIYPIITTYLWNTTVLKYQDGNEQRISNKEIVNKKFEVTWKYLSSANKTSLINFFNACRGAYESFTWLNPEDSTSYTVRFAEDDINKEYFTYNLWNFNRIVLVGTLVASDSILISYFSQWGTCDSGY